MTTEDHSSRAELASTAREDQAATAVAQPVGTTASSVAEPADAAEPQADEEQKDVGSKPHNLKAKASPAKATTSGPVQSEERSGRRERKQTAFFQPEKKTEAEKLEIKEASIAVWLVTSSQSEICCSSASAYCMYSLGMLCLAACSCAALP